MFPKSTEFNKRIPKTKFYEQIGLGRKIKDSFVKDIRYWLPRSKA